MNNNLEDKITLLYDFNYSKNFTNKVDIDINKIDMNNIILDDIKFSNKESSSYQSVLDEIYNGAKFKLVSFDDTNKTTILKRYSDTFSTVLFITPYGNIKTIDKMTSSNNNDALFSYILSPLVLKKKTRHILLPVLNIDTDIQQLSGLLKSYPQYEDYMKDIENEKYTNMFSVRVKENFFKGTTLKEYLENKQCNIKPLLFQVIHTLAVIQDEFPGFRHNMLNFNSIFIYEKEKNIEKYTFNKKEYYVDNDGIDIKFTNFYNSIIPKYFTKTSKIPFSDKYERNDYFDLHYFLNRLIHSDLFNIDCNKETQDFLNKVIPKKYRNKTNNFYLERFVEHIRPKDLLDDEYFKEYKEKKNIEQDISENNYFMGKKTISKNNYFMGKGKITMDSDNESILGKQKNIKQHIVNTRTINNNINTKQKIIRKPSMTGGAYFNLPENKMKNTPFVSNEQRNIYKKEKNIDKLKEEPSDKPNDNIIMEQKVERNPVFKPKFKPSQREPKPWEDMKNTKIPDNIALPQGEVHYSSDKPKYDKTKSRYETKNITDQPLLAEQKVYQPMAKETIGHKHPTYNQPAYIDTTTQELYPPAFVNDYSNYPIPQYVKKVNEIPLQKIYNINLGNGDTNHTMLNTLYEDILPGDPFTYSYIDTFQRDELRNFIRNTVLSKGDGESISLQPSNGKSLLSYFRILHFNPYGEGKKQPYKNLPYNYLFYNMAYPVNYEDGRVNPAKNSLGLNLRIYGLSLGANNYMNALMDKTDSVLDKLSFDVWRDVYYYEMVRNLFNKKVTPNFINMLFYTLDKETKLKYDELKTIIDKHKSGTQYELLLDKAKKLYDGITNIEELKKYYGKEVVKSDDLNKQSGNSLLVVTEAPTYSLSEWAEPLYNNFDALHKMVSTGQHTIDEWKSVLFQILYNCMVMEKYKFYYTNFDIYNIFVKDLFVNKSSVNYWKYNINGIEYYVPNYGYLVMFDSRFKDIVKDGEQKITFNDTTNTFYNKIKELFASANTFTKINKPTYINDIIKSIYNDLTIGVKLEDIIKNKFYMMLHNRIGTNITTSERNNFTITKLKDIVKGNMVVYQQRYEDFIWAIYSGEGKNNKKKIITKVGNVIQEIEVFPHSIINYPSNEPILQDNSKNIRFDNDSLIETYIL